MIENLDTATASKFMSGLMQIEAQEALMLIDIVCHPNKKKEDQSKIHKQLYKTAYPNKRKKKLSLDDLEVALRG